MCTSNVHISARMCTSLSRKANQSHTTRTLKYILAVWPRDNSRPPSLTHSLARTSERHSRILYCSCTLVACTHAQSLLFARTLCPTLWQTKQHTPPATTAGPTFQARVAVHGIGCTSVSGQENEPYPELAVRARTRSTLYYRRRLPGLNTYHTTRRCRGGTRR